MQLVDQQCKQTGILEHICEHGTLVLLGGGGGGCFLGDGQQQRGPETVKDVKTCDEGSNISVHILD